MPRVLAFCEVTPCIWPDSVLTYTIPKYRPFRNEVFQIRRERSVLETPSSYPKTVPVDVDSGLVLRYRCARTKQESKYAEARSTMLQQTLRNLASYCAKIRGGILRRRAQLKKLICHPPPPAPEFLSPCVPFRGFCISTNANLPSQGLRSSQSQPLGGGALRVLCLP
jgi:hypothetical protein